MWVGGWCVGVGVGVGVCVWREGGSGGSKIQRELIDVHILIHVWLS